MGKPLDGIVVLVPESRELDLFAGMLEAQGARPWRCPLVAIKDLDDPAAASAWIARLIDGRFDDVILQTGEGFRRLLALAGPSQDAAIAAFGKVRTIVRGPKPVRALRDNGLSPGLTASQPTSAGLIETLSGERLAGRRIGLQSYPDASPDLAAFLAAQGAEVDIVVPYAYVSDADDDRVIEAIGMMAAGEIAVAAFTSSPQVRRLAEVAHRRGLDDKLSQGLSRTGLAAVGPVVAAALEAIGGHVTIVPAENFHLKPLVREIVRAVAGPI